MDNRYVIIIDFDGTITTEDVSEYILIHFADGDWKGVEDMAVAGEITMNQCMVQQYGMIKGDPDRIIEKSREIGLREGFLEFYQLVNELDLRMICVSAGLSFIIYDLFQHYQINLPVVAPEAELTPQGIDLTLLEVDPSFVDFKHQEVNRHQSNGNRIIYIGDGSSDFGGARFADIRFTVKGSSLSRLCKQEQMSHHDFVSFSELKDVLLDLVNNPMKT